MVEDKVISSAVGDIHLPGRSMPLDSSFEFKPNNPFTLDIENEKPSEDIAYPGFPIEKEKAGFFETAKEEFKATSTNVKVAHALDERPPERPNAVAQFYYPDIGNNFVYRPAPSGWTPKQEIEKISNLDPKFMPKLLAARNPQDFQYRLDDIYAQQRHDQVLENGSTMGKIIGGLLGLSPIGSIENLIPITALATKAKVGAGALDGVMKAFPSMLAAGAIRSTANQMDKIDKSLPEFLIDTFVDASFGTVLFGGAGAFKSLINISEFNRIKEYAKNAIKGIGFEYVVNAEGDLKGFKAVDTTGSLSAAQVTKAQELADAAFHKGGLFKIPYVGAASLAILSGNIPGLQYHLGSPLVRLVTSKYKAAAAFANSAFDHFITTEGEAKGQVRSLSFEYYVKQTRALLTSLKAQTVALHAERNGYTITARPAIGIQNAWSAMKQKSLEAISQQSKTTDYISEDLFLDEVQHVIYSEQSSEHAAVNTAAAIYRKIIDDTYKAFRVAHNLPEDWLPPRTAQAYLMRVYDIKYLNENEGQWTSVVSNWLRQSDDHIAAHVKPINDAKEAVKTAKSEHELLLKSGKATDDEIKAAVNKTESLKRKHIKLRDDLTNRMRSDNNLYIHIDDPHALSADEAKQIKLLLKPVKKKKEVVAKIQKELDELRKKTFFEKGKVSQQRTNAKGQAKISNVEANEKLITEKEADLKIAKDDVIAEEEAIQQKIADGKVRHNLYNKIPDSGRFALKDPKNLLKFRKTYATDSHREEAAKAYYDSIMNMHPQDVIADVFGKLTGKVDENPLKQRTLPVPDEILYNNNFMTKDLYSKTANYVTYLSRRTHLKNSFQDVTVNGGFEELAESLLSEHKKNRDLINERISKLTDKKEIEKEKKLLRKEKIDFEAIKKDMKMLYENRMMGLNRRSDRSEMWRRTWMSLTAAANLHNLPAMQVTDLAFGGFQHGIWPFVRDAIYPIINSMAGWLKTKDSEALREMAPHLHLGYQDVLNNYADRNWTSELLPYINMGKIVSGAEKVAHFTALTDLSPYIDNGVQHAHGSVIQSRFMELLHKQLDGKLTEKESLYLRKYGIDPKKWAKRMVDAYKNSSGFKTNLGGYVSKAWQWQDLEASNIFNNAVFRGIQNTLVWKGMGDSPFFADDALGMFFHTFTGWGYAATNRYLIPSMQHPDAELLIKMLFMGGAGALVSPLRRLARGDDPWPDDMSEIQHAYEAFTDSGIFSTVGNVLNIANFLSSDRLLGDLKNDKFRNRARTGIFGMSDVISSTANRVGDVLGMFTSGVNEKDLKTAAHMLPIIGSMYGHYLGDKMIESWNLPRNKRAAEQQ
jgi:hypothetical protein